MGAADISATYALALLMHLVIEAPIGAVTKILLTPKVINAKFFYSSTLLKKFKYEIFYFSLRKLKKRNWRNRNDGRNKNQGNNSYRETFQVSEKNE